MLTMGGGPLGPPFVVGENPFPSAFSSGNTNNLYVSAANPAPRTGILSSATITTNAAGTAYVVTGSMSGTTFTVTATQSIAAASGTNTYVIACPINSGDLIGFWSAATGPKLASSGGSGQYKAPLSTVPTGSIAGFSLTAGAILAIQATGT